jgi:adenylosuccinate synthase
MVLRAEIEALERIGADPINRVWISKGAHIVVPSARLNDVRSDGIQTTGYGIGPTYARKASRIGMRVGDLLRSTSHEELDPQTTECAVWLMDRMGSRIVDGASTLRDLLDKGGRVIAEGAQGARLDLDHGDYPHVTASNTTIGAVFTGLGVTHKDIRKVLVVTSAYMTKVGSGPFETEIIGPMQDALRAFGRELDGATNKVRSVGWLDLESLRRSIWVNGADGIVLTKVDVLSRLGKAVLRVSNAPPVEEEFPIWSIPKRAQALPEGLRNYMTRIESVASAPISMVSFGEATSDVLMT